MIDTAHSIYICFDFSLSEREAKFNAPSLIGARQFAECFKKIMKGRELSHENTKTIVILFFKLMILVILLKLFYCFLCDEDIYYDSITTDYDRQRLPILM